MFNVLSRIDELGIARGISKYKLAKMTGIAQSTIATWYSKNLTPPLDKLELICNAYEITLPEFFTTAETMKDSNVYSELDDLSGKWGLLDGRQKDIVMSVIDEFLREK